MTIILSLLALIITIIITGRILSSLQISSEIKTLFSQSEPMKKIFSYSQLEDLPEPVERYFRHVMKNGQPYISYVRLTHVGVFKTDPKKDWVNIKGEQYFTTGKPGFIWKGSTAMFTARDRYRFC